MSSLILNYIKGGRIFQIPSSYDLNQPTMSHEEMKAMFDYFHAFWKYEGGPCKEKPHICLDSGMHSNGFIACKKVLTYSRMNSLFADVMTKKISNTLLSVNIETVDVVVSSSSLGPEIAKILSYDNKKIEYRDLITINDGIDSSKNVLIVTEFMNNSIIWETKLAVQNCNGVGNRSPKIIEPSFNFIHKSINNSLPDKSQVVSIFDFDIISWEPNDCPYCKVGSKAIEQKDWETLL